ncbi:hypothetical protein JMF97_04125 [Micromonospora fiedleri]|uniref:Uncharacterized protein n=1 Tax=Micromonospora fiedleri TaxID=1157498 RepID=A0ABS1UG93_9ACTN|nr:hypothetical protein [Micromonospora fiedleri]MBL6275347.1 hypothetical protein [Micromonospora fiedleri]
MAPDPTGTDADDPPAEFVTRLEHEAKLAALTEECEQLRAQLSGLQRLGALNLRRVTALEKAAEIAKGLRSTGLARADAVPHPALLAYAEFLLTEPPEEEVAGLAKSTTETP